MECYFSKDLDVIKTEEKFFFKKIHILFHSISMVA